MDIEKPVRAKVAGALAPAFLCYEEVVLEHVLFSAQRVRTDVLAIPLDPEFHDVALAIEVKCPGEDWNTADWCECIHQASDYVLARVVSGVPPEFHGRRVSASFLYPPPPIRRAKLGDQMNHDLEHGLMITGAMHLSVHRRVGSLDIGEIRGSESATLRVGPNELWSSRRGWLPKARNILTGKRRVGSQKVDVLAALDGAASGQTAPPAPWE